MAKERKILLTPVARLCFPNVFEKERQMDNSSGEPGYTATLVFDKEFLKKNPEELARFRAMTAAAEEACVEKFKKPLEAASKLANFHKPFRDGIEKEHLDGFGPGTIFTKLKTKRRPGVVAADGRTPLTTSDELYPGCYVRCSVSVWAYDNKAKGVKFTLNNVMFVRDGDRLDGGTKAEADFGEVAIDEAPDGDLI